MSEIYPKWQKWYAWFYISQENPFIPYTFSWQARGAEENFPSGFDDYPRAYRINEREEIHLDLQSWMVEFSTTMSLFAAALGKEAEQENYDALAKRIKYELEEKLYNENVGMYADFAG